MAKLNPSIIYSLTTDLSELHEIGRDMVKQIEAHKIISWRYPDRASKDINIVVETELFDTGDYVLLLELIIDRLYFILSMALHRLSALPELSNGSYECNLPKNVSKPVGISFGTLVSFLWKRLQCLNSSNFQGSTSNLLVNTSSLKSSVDSKLICENCSTSYTILKNIIKCLEECMVSLKFQSKCKECRQNCEKNIMNLSQEDVMKLWADALQLDIKYIINYADLKTSENKSISKEITDIRIENDITNKKSRAVQKKNFDLEILMNEMEVKLQTVLLQNQELSLNYNDVVAELSTITEENNNKEKKLNEIEIKIHDIIKKREESIELLKSEFGNQINCAHNERDTYKNLYTECKLRLDDVEEIYTNYRDNETNVKNNLEKYEIEAKDLQDINVKLQNKCETFEETIKHLKLLEGEYLLKIQSFETDKSKLQNELKECKEREILLLRCPDLNGPIISKDNNEQIKCPAKNPCEDMKQQLRANEVRVNLLQEQNEKLKRIINKMQLLPT